jgi:hypothetical protein
MGVRPRFRNGARVRAPLRALVNPQRAWLLLQNIYNKDGSYVKCHVHGLVYEDDGRFRLYPRFVDDGAGFFLVAPRLVAPRA